MTAAQAAAPATLRSNARRIAALAWPMLAGQLAVLGFSTVDTVLVARHSAAALAAFAVGSAAYITVFIGLMGVVLAIGPIVGQLFGAKRLEEAGRQLHQCVWLALGLALPGCALLVFPAPFIALARATPEMAGEIRGYLLALACSLPAALLFTVYRGFNTAVSRPKAVMVLQIGGLALKVPLSMALVFGVPALGIPEFGVTGCGLATMLAVWTQALGAYLVLRRDPFYRAFALHGHGLAPPDKASLLALLKLGVPMGLTILIEVTGFAFMAIFIARLGPASVAGHQITANVVSLLFMVPLSLANATTTLVAQRIGAGRLHDASRLGTHGLTLTLALALVTGTTVYLARQSVVQWYTHDAAVAASAVVLLQWVALFHAGDALQTFAQLVLRAWKVTGVSLLVFALSMWGVGLGGGYVLAFDVWGITPPAWRGAPGFWAASVAGLFSAGVVLTGFLLWLQRQRAATAAA